MTNSHLGYFLNPALFSMCRIVSWIKYETQFTNSCLAYSGSWVSKNQIICLQLSRPLFFGCFKHILSWDNFYTFAVACYVPYFLGPSPSFSDFPVTFPPVPDHFRVLWLFPSVFRLSPLSFRLFRHPSFPCFPSISIYLFVSTRFLSVFHIRIRP